MENLNIDTRKIENAKSIKLSQKAINFSIIFRIAQTTLLAFFLAWSYSDKTSNLLRIYVGSESLLSIVILADLILTALWTHSKNIYRLHFILYIIFGGTFLFGYMMIAPAVSSQLLFVTYICLPGLWILGLIPFIIYKKASYKLMVEKIRYKK